MRREDIERILGPRFLKAGSQVLGSSWQGKGMERQVTIGRTAAVVSVMMLATGPSIVKISELPEMTFIFWRLGAAALGYAVALRLSGKRFSWEAWRRSLLGGLVFGVNLVFFVLGMRRTSAANAVMIGALQPVVLIGVAGPFFGERPRRTIYFWSLLAMGGVALSMVASGSEGVASRQGDLLAFAGMLLFSAYFVVSKKARQELDSMTYQLGLTLTAVLVVVPFAVFMGQSLAPPGGADWWPVLLMAAIPGTGHWLTNYAHGQVSLVAMSLINLLFTVVAPLYAWVLVGETVGGWQAAGMGLVLAALTMVVSRPIEAVSR